MAVLCLLLICFSAGEAHTMRALVGDDVTLSVDTTTSSDIGESVMEWSRLDLSSDIVHLCSLLPVITLTPPPGAASSPVITLEDYTSSGLVLGCRAKGWAPARFPVLLRLTDGHLLPAVTMTTTQDTDRLYNISSTVVVERKSPNRHLICRVHQELFNQTRETEIHLPENLFRVLAQLYARSYGLGFLPASLVFLSVALGTFVMAYRIIHGNSKKQKDEGCVVPN
ncbi:unnamed protein product [Boreogadus saida]